MYTRRVRIPKTLFAQCPAKLCPVTGQCILAGLKLGKSVHDLGRSVHDLGRSVHDLGKSVHDLGKYMHDLGRSRSWKREIPGKSPRGGLRPSKDWCLTQPRGLADPNRMRIRFFVSITAGVVSTRTDNTTETTHGRKRSVRKSEYKYNRIFCR